MMILKGREVIIVTKFEIIYTGTILGTILNDNKKYIKLKISRNSETQIIFPIDEINMLILDEVNCLTYEMLEDMITKS